MAAMSGRLVQGTMYAVPLLAKSRRIAISPSRSSSQTRAMRSAGSFERHCRGTRSMLCEPIADDTGAYQAPMSLHEHNA